MTLKAAGYVRCSTDKQEMSIPAQKAAIVQYADQSGFEVLEWFEDFGKSGASVKGRPGFAALMDRIGSGTRDFEAVLVYDTDRWGRFVDPEESTYHRFECKRHGAPVVFVVDAGVVNQNNAVGRMSLNMKQELATEESRKRSAIVYERSILNAQRGFSSGGRPPYGYQRWAVDSTGARRLLADGRRKSDKSERVLFLPGPDEAVQVVRRIFHMRGTQKLGYGAIADRLNAEGIPSPCGGKWGKVYMAHLLSNPAYIGVLTYGKTKRGKFRTSAGVEATPKEQWATAQKPEMVIVDRALWDRVQATGESRRGLYQTKKGRTTASPYLLSGLLVCTECGYYMQGNKRRNAQGRVYGYYSDSGARHGGASVCGPFHIQQAFIESEVLAVARGVMLRGLDANRIIGKLATRLSQQDKQREKRSREVQKGLAGVERQLSNLVRAVAEGTEFAVLHEAIQRLQAEKKKLEVEAKMLALESSREPDRFEEAADLVAQLRDFGAVLSHGTLNQRKAILRRMVPKIEISRQELTATVYVNRLGSILAGKSVEDLDVVATSVSAGGRNSTEVAIGECEKHVIDLSRIIRLKQGRGRQSKVA